MYNIMISITNNEILVSTEIILLYFVPNELLKIDISY